MKDYGWLTLAGGADHLALEDGTALVLLTSRQVLEAKGEALDLARAGRDPALCANACLVARALTRAGEPVYPSGRAVLEALPPAAIEDLARTWADFDRRENPGLGADPARVEELKTALEGLPQERLKWRVLRAFRALPTEERVKAMTGRDYLWCALHLLLDQEEEAARLCPACRAEAEEARCPVCGRAVGEVTRGENPGFDLDRFERLKKGGVL